MCFFNSFDCFLTQLNHRVIPDFRGCFLTDEEFNGGVGDNLDWTKLSDKALQTHMGILNAYFLPEVKKDKLPSFITPVNTFRLIFNRYFGTTLPFLEDKSYIIRDTDHPYVFIDVTDRLKSKD